MNPAKLCSNCSQPFTRRTDEKQSAFYRRACCSTRCAGSIRNRGTRDPYLPHWDLAKPLRLTMDDAACRTLGDPDWWTSPPMSWETQQAKKICGTCPLRQACLAAAMDIGIRDSVWGGLDPQERLRLASIECRQ